MATAAKIATEPSTRAIFIFPSNGAETSPLSCFREYGNHSAAVSATREISL
jgi:hypothetical protein